MLSVDQGVDVFFDATENLSSEESVVVKENRLCNSLGYDIWLREPQSVKERRDTFLFRMGFVEDSSSVVESEVIELEGVTEPTGGEFSCDSSNVSMDDDLLSERRGSHSEANCSVDYSDQDWLDLISIDSEHEMYKNLVSDAQYEKEDSPGLGKKKKKLMRWLRHFSRTMKKSRGSKLSMKQKLHAEAGLMSRIKMVQNRKKYMECTGVYAGQEINAHNGLIWTMKFSPDGQYLASGGEDGVVCIWRVSSVDTSTEAEKCSFGSQDLGGKSSPQKKKPASIVIPEKRFYIEEEPLQKFRGHNSDVLDLAWSTSNHLLSSSTDKTVRLWQLGSNKCLGVFQHSNYVTCVQFNPVNENYFISGSIDGTVRIWGVHKRRVEDWANVKDIVTAVCYQSNGKGFVVGSVSGTCRFYELSGDELLLNAEINITGRSSKITGIQYLKDETQRVMVTSEDSKIRLLDGLEVVRKYKGLAKSGSQMSASFTSGGKHIVSVGEDSRVYIWNHDDLAIQTSKPAKSTQSCEHFFSEGVTVALPWSDITTEQNSSACNSPLSSMPTHEEASPSSVLDSERFSLANWFSMDSSSRGSSTWPEEKLPSCYLPSTVHNFQPCSDYPDHFHQHSNSDRQGSGFQSTTWGLVFVTAHWDGTIRTFHNYGLPART